MNDSKRRRLRKQIFDSKCYYIANTTTKVVDCHYCKKVLTFDNYTLDHVIPSSKGGSDTKDNLVPCCQACNSKKANEELKRFKLSPERIHHHVQLTTKEIANIILALEDSELEEKLTSLPSLEFNCKRYLEVRLAERVVAPVAVAPAVVTYPATTRKISWWDKLGFGIKKFLGKN